MKSAIFILIEPSVIDLVPEELKFKIMQSVSIFSKFGHVSVLCFFFFDFFLNNKPRFRRVAFYSQDRVAKQIHYL